MMTRKSAIVREAGFSFTGFLTGQGLRYLFTVAVAVLFGAEYLGVYALALGAVQIAEVAAVGGLDAGVLRFVNLHDGRPEEQRARIAAALKASLYASAPIAMLLMLVSGPLASLLRGDEPLRLALLCYAASLPFAVFTAVAGHAIQAFGNVRPKIVSTQLIVPGGMLLAAVSLNALAGPLPALLAALPAASVVGCAWTGWKLRRLTGVGPSAIPGAAAPGKMALYARPLMFVTLLAATSHWLDIFMLGWYTDAGTVGLYQPAVRTAGLVRSVLLAFAGIVSPMFASLHARGETAELGRIFRIVNRWVLLAALPPTVVLLVMPETVLAVFGPEFVAVAPVLAVLAAAVLVQSFFGLCDTLLQMTGYSKTCLVNSAAGLGLHALLNMALIPRYGMVGAAAALLVVYLLVGGARAFEVRRFLGMHAFSPALLKPLAAAVSGGMLLAFLRPLLETLPLPAALAGAFCLVLAVYAAFVRLMQLEQEEMDVIFELLPFLKKT